MTPGDLDRGGPYVKGAFLCDTVIEGKDGVNSYIRVVDQLNVGTQLVVAGEPPPGTEVPDLPEGLPPGSTVRAWLVILFASGGAQGRSPVTLRMRSPDGLVRDLAETIDVHFDGRQSSGANLHIDLNMVVEQEGPYSVLVVLDDKLVTRVPFEVRYQRLPEVRGGRGRPRA